MPPRADFHVVARMLDRLAEPGRWSYARLQAATRLNYDLFLRYLGELERRGWVRCNLEGERTAELTAAGHEARAQLAAWLQRWVQESRF